MNAYGDYITIIPINKELKSQSGMILDKKLVRFREGEVYLSVVNGIKAGDKVIYDSANTHKSALGNEYLITKAMDIAVIL